MTRYCDHCQLTRKECDEQGNCVGAMERDYARRLAEWEASDEYVEGQVY